MYFRRLFAKDPSNPVLRDRHLLLMNAFENREFLKPVEDTKENVCASASCDCMLCVFTDFLALHTYTHMYTYTRTPALMHSCHVPFSPHGRCL